MTLVSMPSSSMDRIIWAAKKVSAHEDIEAFTDGYETHLEENAENLSTGMRQKLQIARALIRNPRVLIFDDAISGFDVDSANEGAQATCTVASTTPRSGRRPKCESVSSGGGCRSSKAGGKDAGVPLTLRPSANHTESRYGKCER